MERNSFTVFLISMLLFAGCTRETGLEKEPVETTKPLPEKKALNFEWIRSERDTETSTLRMKWKLTGEKASEITDEQSNVTIAIDRSHIEYFPSAGKTNRLVTMKAEKGTFHQNSDLIIFSPSTEVNTFDADKERTVSMNTEELEYRSKEETAVCNGEFSLSTDNLYIRGTGLEYFLEANKAAINGGATVEIEEELNKQNILNPPLPLVLQDKREFLSNIIYEQRMLEGMDKTILSTPSAILLDIELGTITLNGPVTIDASTFTVFADTIFLVRSERVSAFKERTRQFENIQAQGNILFKEKYGDQRTVSCGRLSYDMSHRIVVMTGSPVLKSKDTVITSTRMKYLPDEETFIFAKPYKIESAVPKKGNREQITEDR